MTKLSKEDMQKIGAEPPTSLCVHLRTHIFLRKPTCFWKGIFIVYDLSLGDYLVHSLCINKRGLEKIPESALSFYKQNFKCEN